MKTKKLLLNGLVAQTTMVLAPGLTRRRFVEIEPLPLPTPLQIRGVDHPTKLTRQTAGQLLGRPLPSSEG